MLRSWVGLGLRCVGFYGERNEAPTRVEGLGLRGGHTGCIIGLSWRCRADQGVYKACKITANKTSPLGSANSQLESLCFL